ncbi:MAG: class II fructose-bisphosphate aldolase [Patescibacteria group bacterium]|nr:class II fructose-bisphosphate aldolase [Patescibacteria group bacterium]MCL5431938.1 class II fructose-bisphosphate aldolase [Patescibacteria group bacterium]
MSKAKYWFERAKNEHFAIGAFNAASIETLKAIVGAAKNLRSPVIIEASPGEAEYFGIKELVGATRVMEQSNGVPIILNLDHAPDYDHCRVALEAGFDYLHLDGSKLDIEENIRQTRRLADEAHKKGVLVEGEIDNINVLGAGSADHRGKNIDVVRDPKYYTDPAKAADFVEKTQIDTLASFIGNVHGMYAQTKNINLDLLREIKARLGQTYLSLHGGSGIPANEITAAIGIGVQKINVNTQLRLAFRDKLKETLDAPGPPAGGEVAIYKIMPAAIAAMQAVVEEKIKLFGSANKI